MASERIETSLRVAGGVATAVTVGTILQGLRRSSRRQIARQGGRLLTVLHTPAAIAGASAAGIAVLSTLWRPLPLRLPKRVATASTLVGATMFFSGIGIFHWGRRTMGEMYDVSTSQGAQLYADHRLVTGGPFGYVRHPLYVGGILAEIGALLMYRTWTTALVALNVFSLVKRAAVEEKALAEEFGEDWARYAARVPRWLPRLGG